MAFNDKLGNIRVKIHPQEKVADYGHLDVMTNLEIH